MAVPYRTYRTVNTQGIFWEEYHIHHRPSSHPLPSSCPSQPVQYMASQRRPQSEPNWQSSRTTYLLLLVIKLFPFRPQQSSNLPCTTAAILSMEGYEGHNIDSPNPASGFSVLILSRQSWLKNIYADIARLGALGSFFAFPPRVAFSAFTAALRCGGRVRDVREGWAPRR